ncbi:MAG: 4Fe-4S dicluster domain-containing protein [Desulfobacteraceae bacterium]|nr:MAG: 4Fe-4S dicluster domain-containing protein [Desulfobacteraceae bacterium]
MDNELYRQLQKHLHKQPAGFPETESGSEIDILKRFYTPEQAKIALKMTNIPEPPVKIAKRLKMDAKKAGESLEQMAKEGLLFRIHTPEAPLYAQPNFIMGIYEWHVNMVDREIAEKVDHVYDGLFEKHWKDKKVKQLRVVPVEKSIEHKDTVHPYRKIKELVAGKENEPYAVAPCICRVEQAKKGAPGDRPLETCLLFGMAASYYIENGFGRRLTRQELFEKLDECEKAALIPMGTNSQKITNMCMCDKESCQLLRNIKKEDKPAEMFHSGYMAKLDPSSCVGCGICDSRCQMDAVFISGYKEGKKKTPVFSINEDSCIGCGLCVTACAPGAMQLADKKAPLDVPETYLALNLALAKERGQLQGYVPYGVVKWLLKLKLGRETADKVINM